MKPLRLASFIELGRAVERLAVLRDRLARGPHQEAPRPPKGAHYHFCVSPGCETYLVCGGGDDRCGVEAKWVCPACELAAVDAYLTAQERRLEEKRER